MLNKKVFLTGIFLIMLSISVFAQGQTIFVLPDNPLYPAKLAFEGVIGFFKGFGTKQAQIEYSLSIAITRLAEAEAMNRVNKPLLARQTLQRYQETITGAELNVIQTPNEQEKMVLASQIVAQKGVAIQRINMLPKEVLPIGIETDPLAVQAQDISLDFAARNRFGLFLNQAKTQCEQNKGTWKFEKNWVGCDGIGPKNCALNVSETTSNIDLVGQAVKLCGTLGGKVSCNEFAAYCKRQ